MHLYQEVLIFAMQAFGELGLKLKFRLGELGCKGRGLFPLGEGLRNS